MIVHIIKHTEILPFFNPIYLTTIHRSLATSLANRYRIIILPCLFRIPSYRIPHVDMGDEVRVSRVQSTPHEVQQEQRRRDVLVSGNTPIDY